MTEKRLKLLCYSDIHYHEYQNGITIDDVAAVEQEFIKLADDLEVDAIIFGGDRFLSRNPTAVASYIAAENLLDVSALKIPIIALVGNHDRVYKNNFKAHNLQYISLYPSELRGINVLAYGDPGYLTVCNTSIKIHAIPAGHAGSARINVDKKYDFNICLFHDIVRGSKYTNGIVAEEGLSPNLLIDHGLDLILGGDNHHHQTLSMFDAPAWYIGAPMQHNWGDSGDERGFLYIELIKSDAGVRAEHKFIPSHAPKFIKLNATVASTTDLAGLIQANEASWGGNIIKLTLSGPADTLNDIDTSSWADKIKDVCKACTVKVHLEYKHDIAPNTGVNTITPRTDIDHWNEFLDLKASTLDAYDIDRLKKLGMGFINDV